jgi:hypothetical protein
MSGTPTANSVPEAPAASAAKLHVLDLTELKLRLGTKWSRLEGHVEQFFVTAIQKSLAPGDSFSRTGELSYVVLFRGLNEAEAQLKCRAISEDVCRRLFGEQSMQVTLRNLVAQVRDADEFANAETAPALDAMLEKRGKESLVSIDTKSECARQDETHLRLRFANGTNAFLAVPPGDIEFVYRPIWDSLKQVVVTYLCQPTFGSRLAQDQRPAGFCVAEDENDQATLDLLILRECAERVAKIRRDGLRVLIAAPLSFETLTRQRHWARYGQVHRELPQGTSRDLATLVYGIGSGVPGIRLGQELPKLASYTKNIFCVTDDIEGSSARFAGTGARALGLVFSSNDYEPHMIERLKKLGQSARDAALEAAALGVQTTSLALSAIAGGVRYLEGPAIRAASPDPRHAFSQSLEYLYAQKLAQAG